MKKIFTLLWSSVKALFHTVTFLRNLVFNTLFLLILLAIVAAVLSNDQPTSLKNNSALLLKIKGNIVEEKQLTNPFSEVFDASVGFAQLPQETLLQDVIQAIEYAKNDSRISVIVLDLSELGSCSLDQLHDIGNALERFKTTGKQVIAADDSYTQSSYYLATFASKIFLNPMGMVEVRGLAASSLYFKDALDKLKIHYHVFKVGTYKSAVEPFTRNSMSNEAKTQNSTWLTALWDEYCHQVKSTRKISQETLDLYTNFPSLLLEKVEGDTARVALQNGFVDGLKTREQRRAYLQELTAKSSEQGFRSISLTEYLQLKDQSIPPTPQKNSIAVLVAEGNIMPGEQTPGNIGSDTLIRQIRKALFDNSIKAVVLRVNSGGGSVIASEMIRNQLQELKKNKPLIISMSGMAASGAYWISAQADEIWAYPTTLTGSIGIFGMIPTFEDSLAQLGVYSDSIGTTTLSTSMDATAPLSNEMEKIVQLNINHGYSQFLHIVADGRKKSINDIEKIAEGRVYDGKTAHNLGLVDKLGNLDDAIHSAAKRAGVASYSIRYLQSEQSFTDMLLFRLQQGISGFLPKVSWSPSLIKTFKTVASTAQPFLYSQDPQGMYAKCPIEMQ